LSSHNFYIPCNTPAPASASCQPTPMLSSISSTYDSESSNSASQAPLWLLYLQATQPTLVSSITQQRSSPHLKPRAYQEYQMHQNLKQILTQLGFNVADGMPHPMATASFPNPYLNNSGEVSYADVLQWVGRGSKTVQAHEKTFSIMTSLMHTPPDIHFQQISGKTNPTLAEKFTERQKTMDSLRRFVAITNGNGSAKVPEMKWWQRTLRHHINSLGGEQCYDGPQGSKLKSHQ